MSTISNFFNVGNELTSITVTTGAGENLTANDVVMLNEEKVRKFLSGDGLVSGTASVFESAATDYTSVAMLTSTKAIVTYQDNGNSNYGTACVLDISGSSITPGTPVVFESATTNYISVAMLTSTKAIVTYRDTGNLSYGTACVLDISGSSITPGTPAVFESALTNYTSVAMLTSTKAIVAYKDGGNSSYGTACILDISGSSITPDVPVVFESGTTSYISAAMLTSTKAIVAYQDGGNSSYGTGCVLPFLVPQQICGIADTTVSEDDDITITIDGVKGGFTSLSIGYKYYVDNLGDLTTEVTDNPLGKAVSTTEIFLNGSDFLLKNMSA